MTVSREVTSRGAAVGLLLLVTSAVCAETSKTLPLTSSSGRISRRRVDHPKAAQVDDVTSATKAVPANGGVGLQLDIAAMPDGATIIPRAEGVEKRRRRHRLSNELRSRNKRSNVQWSSDIDFDELPSLVESDNDDIDMAAASDRASAKRRFYGENLIRQLKESNRQATRRAYYTILDRILNRVSTTDGSEGKLNSKPDTNPWMRWNEVGSRLNQNHASVPYSAMIGDSQRIGLPISGQIPVVATGREQKRYRWLDDSDDLNEVDDKIDEPQIRSSGLSTDNVKRSQDKALTPAAATSNRDEPMRHRWSTYFIGR